MLTRCPQCETIFRVSKKHISAAKGLVRCGSCKDIFNAKEHVIKSKKDLKRPITTTKPEAQVTTTAEVKENKIVKKQSAAIKVPTAITPDKKDTAKTGLSNIEPNSFDFINDGFTSTGSREKFDTSTPEKHISQNKKPISKAEALERGKPTSLNFNSVFDDETPKVSTEDIFIIKKPTAPQNNNGTNENKPASFTPKTLQPHQATVVKPISDKKSNTTGSFISKNVIDIKNAFTSISKKITTKVANKIQLEKPSDEVVKKSLESKLINSNLAKKSSPTITETNVSTPAPVKAEKLKKPTIMSINSETDIFDAAKNNVDKKPILNKLKNEIETTSHQASSPNIKIKPQLKEDAALKLAIRLKKAAQEKTPSTIDKKATFTKPSESKNKPAKSIIENKEQKLNEKSINEFKKAVNTSLQDLNVVNLTSTIKPELNKTDNKSAQNKEPEPKLQQVVSEVEKNPKEALKQTEQKSKTLISETKEKVENKRDSATDNKDSNLISKDNSDLDEELEEDNDDHVHIHMQTVDIPMVLRESLEELDLPTRSAEMTIFMIMSLIVLCFGLLLQFAVFRSIEVQQKYPSLKPLITKVCKTFTCDYNGPRDIKKIQLISRDIRVHPTTKGALLISATIINNANYQQPYPNFSVKLSNLSGKTTAHRFFSPNDYLGKLSNKLLLMPPKQPIRIALEVVDPGKEAINFEFKFISRN